MNKSLWVAATLDTSLSAMSISPFLKGCGQRLNLIIIYYIHRFSQFQSYELKEQQYMEVSH